MNLGNRLFLFAGIALALSLQVADARSYTLDEVVKAGLESSKQIKAVRQEMTKTDAQIREAYGSALPTIDGSVNLSHAFEQYNPYADKMNLSIPDSVDVLINDSTTIRMPTALKPNVKAMPGATPVDTFIADFVDQSSSALSGFDLSSPPNALALSITLKQPLFAQGKIGIGLKIARTYKQGLQYKLDMMQDSVRASLTKIFYAALLAQKNLEVQQEAVKIATESHRLTVIRWGVGKGSVLDTLSSRLGYEKAIMDQRSATSQRHVAVAALIVQAGLAETPATFAIAGEFPEDESYAVSLDDAQRMLQTGNTLLKQLETGARVQDLLIDVAKSDMYPLVYGGGSIGKIYQFDGFGDIDWASGSDSKVFIGASWTLFSGARRLQKVAQARSDHNSFELTRESVRDGLGIALTSMHENLQTARLQLQQTRSLVELAQRGYAIAKVAYETGQLTLIDLQKRELDLQNAKTALNAAQFAFHSAVVDMKSLTGDL